MFLHPIVQVHELTLEEFTLGTAQPVVRDIRVHRWAAHQPAAAAALLLLLLLSSAGPDAGAKVDVWPLNPARQAFLAAQERRRWAGRANPGV